MTLRRLLLYLLLLAAAGALRAEEPPARFFIERIDIRNAHRVSRDVVVAESRLREGSTYGEQELREASLRVNRAPYLISADFSLEKGSERGKYILVITLNETRPFFFLLDGVFYAARDEHSLREYPNVLSSDDSIAAGFRFFVGPRGAIHFGIEGGADNRSYTSDYSTFAVGYTEYDLFGTRAFATLNLRLPIDSPAEGLISPQLIAGVPLTANQTLTLDYEDTFFRRDTIHLLDTAFHRQDAERLVSLAWTYNSTNQPFVPTRGTIVRIAPLRSMRDRASYQFVHPIPGPPPEPYAEHQNGYGLDFVALRYWELSELNSVSAGVLAGWADVEDRQHPRTFGTDIRWRPAYQIVRAGWSRNLRRDDSKEGDSRIELDGRLVRRQRNVREGAAAFGVSPNNEDTLQASASWVRRSHWGTFRVGVGYAWGY